MSEPVWRDFNSATALKPLKRRRTGFPFRLAPHNLDISREVFKESEESRVRIRWRDNPGRWSAPAEVVVK